jgi:hypothetical protein
MFLAQIATQHVKFVRQEVFQKEVHPSVQNAQQESIHFQKMEFLFVWIVLLELISLQQDQAQVHNVSIVHLEHFLIPLEVLHAKNAHLEHILLFPS